MAEKNKPMTVMRALGVIAFTTVLGGVVGTTLGWLIGTFMPQYYRHVFHTQSPGFNPLEIGMALGVTEGVGVGLIVGVVAVAILTWQHVHHMGKPGAQRALEPED